MKRVVWSETIVKGGVAQTRLGLPTIREGFYEDIAVVAYPALAAGKLNAALNPVVTASDPSLDTALATDGNRDTRTILTASKNAPG